LRTETTGHAHAYWRTGGEAMAGAPLPYPLRTGTEGQERLGVKGMWTRNGVAEWGGAAL